MAAHAPAAAAPRWRWRSPSPPPQVAAAGRGAECRPGDRISSPSTTGFTSTSSGSTRCCWWRWRCWSASRARSRRRRSVLRRSRHHYLLEVVRQPPLVDVDQPPITQTSSVGGLEAGRHLVMDCRNTCSGFTPRTLVREPVMPTSQMNAVPPGRPDRRRWGRGCGCRRRRRRGRRGASPSPPSRWSPRRGSRRSTTSASSPVEDRLDGVEGRAGDGQADAAAEVDHPDPLAGRLDHGEPRPGLPLG